MEKHIRIKSLADLFIDTFPFGAHSSAIDALWGKVPLVSVAGDTIGSRVALSVVCSVLPSCEQQNSLKSMEDLAMHLITDHD